MVPSHRQFYRILHRIADARVGPLERDFLTAIRVSQDDINMTQLMAGLFMRNEAMVFDSVKINGQLKARTKEAFRKQLGKAFHRSALATSVAIQARLDIANPRAIAWAARRGSRLVSQVSTPTRALIRKAIAGGIEQGITTTGTAKVIRGLVGLTRKQSVAALDFRTGLIRDGMGVAEAAEATTRLEGKMLRRRAKVIARTETISASSAGQREVWRQARDAGIIQFQPGLPSQYETPLGRIDGPTAHPNCRCAEGIEIVDGIARRVWIVTPDDRLCEICVAIPEMNPDGVGLADEDLELEAAA